MENWNDDRLDELSRRMDDGFKDMKGEMRQGFDRLERAMSEGFAETNGRIDNVNGRIDNVNGRIDRLMLTLLVSALGIIGALIGGAVL